MNGKQIIDAFSQLSKEWVQFLIWDFLYKDETDKPTAKPRSLLGEVIKKVNKDLADKHLTAESLSPQPSLMFRAFQLCPFEDVKVVLIGQDPYIKKGEAMGLSFSVPKGVTVHPSLKNIYKCLQRSGFLATPPKHGDLSEWAKQGVLLLNCALTTVLGKSNAHSSIWTQYTDKLIAHLSDKKQGLVFILLGGFAEQKAHLVDRQKHSVLTWGHPSPLNSANQTNNLKNFIYCDAFTKTNEILKSAGKTPIDWNPDYNTGDKPIQPICIDIDKHRQCIPDPNTLYVFTDGGATCNGSAECRAAWGYLMVSQKICRVNSGLVPLIDIPGVVYRTSNNRGELMGILKALEDISQNSTELGSSHTKIVIITDSKLCRSTITEWYEDWVKTKKVADKKNIDLIEPIHKLYTNISNISIEHIHSHLNEPAQKTKEWFYWYGNDVVDKLCQDLLAHKD